MRRLLTVVVVMALLGAGCGGDDGSGIGSTIGTSTDDGGGVDEPTGIVFVRIPGDGTSPDFEMSETEVTNDQYVAFLNAAWHASMISYDPQTQKVYDENMNEMIHLGGTRVVKDHDSDGFFELDEMENPLNRSFVAFDELSQSFYVVDPEEVDWSIYFDTSIFPNVVDSIDDWAELNDAGSGFYGEGDTDKQLPSLDEVRTWPVNHVRYYGAEAFARFYGWDLPAKAQVRIAGQGGANYRYATSNGTADEGIAWINVDGPFELHRGHPQPALSKAPNPFGVYNLGGNVWEWCKDWYDGTNVFGGDPKEDDDYFIDDSISWDEADGQYLKCILGGSFNFFPATMQTTWNHAAGPQTGNDHFGFRVTRNP